MKQPRARPPRPRDGLLRGVFDALRSQGWAITMRPGGHVCARSPGGAPVFMSATPSDRFATQNMIGVLRRHGFVWPVR